MIFRITMKDPTGIGSDLRLAALESRVPRGELATFAGRWVDDEEYLTVEFDTDAGTATVVEVGE